MHEPMQPNRTSYLGGSDAKSIMSGNWHELWEEKTGRTGREDLTDVFRVQLGVFTECFNRSWFATHMDLEITLDTFTKEGNRGGTVDGLTSDNGILECKHVNGFYKEDGLHKQYYPQCQHYLSLYPERTHVWLSAIVGNSWETFCWQRNNDYIKELIQAEDAFWYHVETDTPPGKGIEIETPDLPPDEMRSIDMTKSNAWSHHAGVWIETKEAHTNWVDSNMQLKEILNGQENVREASGHGVTATRNKRGAITIKEQELVL